MRLKLSDLTAERLRHLLLYLPETGGWFWLNPPNHNTRLLGCSAGTRHSDGYLMIRIRGKAYYSHRLAFLYMTGEWPLEEVDHIDRNPYNDAWVNLRKATSSLNKWNQERHMNSPYNPLAQMV